MCVATWQGGGLASLKHVHLSKRGETVVKPWLSHFCNYFEFVLFIICTRYVYLPLLLQRLCLLAKRNHILRATRRRIRALERGPFQEPKKHLLAPAPNAAKAD